MINKLTISKPLIAEERLYENQAIFTKKDNKSALTKQAKERFRNPEASFKQIVTVYPASGKDKGRAEIQGQHLIDTLNRNFCDYSEQKYNEISSSKGLGIKLDIADNSNWEIGNSKQSWEHIRGLGGVIYRGSSENSYFSHKTCDSEVNFGNQRVGFEAGIGLGGITAGVEAKADLVNVHTKGGLRANVGIDVGTGFSAGVGGVKAQAAGFGISVGKEMGISTPLGGLLIDLEELAEECVIQ